MMKVIFHEELFKSPTAQNVFESIQRSFENDSNFMLPSDKASDGRPLVEIVHEQPEVVIVDLPESVVRLIHLSRVSPVVKITRTTGNFGIVKYLYTLEDGTKTEVFMDELMQLKDISLINYKQAMLDTLTGSLTEALGNAFQALQGDKPAPIEYVEQEAPKLTMTESIARQILGRDHPVLVNKFLHFVKHNENHTVSAVVTFMLAERNGIGITFHFSDGENCSFTLDDLQDVDIEFCIEMNDLKQLRISEILHKIKHGGQRTFT